MPRANFTPEQLPTSMVDMISLLRLCTPENMSALTECLTLEKPADGTTLAFEEFLDAIAYPVQSYRITAQSRLELLKEIKRLYPDIEPSLSKKLGGILKRMDPALETPVALDSLKPAQNLPLSENYRLPLLGGAIAEGNVKGWLKRFQEPLPQRWQSTLNYSGLNLNVEDKKLAEIYQAILSSLVLESHRVEKAWEWVQRAQASRKIFRELYDTSRLVIRLNHVAEVVLPPDWGNTSGDDDFAFSIQHRELMQQASSLTNGEALYKLYHGLSTYSQQSNSPGIAHMLAFLRKEVAGREQLKFETLIAEDEKQYSSDCAVKEFPYGINENFFVPCYLSLLNIKRVEIDDSLRRLAEYSVSQGLPDQKIADVHAICQIYAEMAPHQADFYRFIYKKLEELVNKDPSKKKQMLRYYKLTIGRILPSELPTVRLEDVDFTETILRELTTPPNQDWSIPTTLAVKTNLRQPRRKVQAACSVKPDESAQASHSDDLVEPVGADIVDEPLVPSEKTLPVLLHPQMPQPFIYTLRVSRWFNAVTPLDHKIFPEYAKEKEAYQRVMIALHAFSSSVDFFLIDLALKTIWRNPTTGLEDERYVLAAEMSNGETGKTRGIITVSVSRRDGKVYHRFFSKKIDSDIREVFAKASYNSDFPSLEDAAAEPTSGSMQSLPSRDPNEKISKHRFWGTVTIKNESTKSQITLFPTRMNIN